MTLQEIVDGIKRDSQAGEVGNNADLSASDILRHFNDCRLEFWNADPWDWSIADIGPITIPAGNTARTSFDANIGEVICLGIVGEPGTLDSFTEKEWRRWQKLANNAPAGGGNPNLATDTVVGYVKRGRDASGNLQVLFVNPPSGATQIEGQGKIRLSPARFAVTDIPNIAEIDYFPDEVQPILRRWAYGRFLDSIKDQRGAGEIAGALQSIELLKGTNRTDPAKDAHTHPPDYIRFVNRKRGGRTVV
jgi:hypothetical protein